MTTLSEQLEVNGLAICDCKNRSFFVGLEVKGGENHIRVLECTECGHQMAVPFQSLARRRRDPTEAFDGGRLG